LSKPFIEKHIKKLDLWFISKCQNFP